jgi:hypothetical protein
MTTAAPEWTFTVVPTDYRSWISARVQALAHDYPSHCKKDRWRIAQKEWLELRRQQKRCERFRHDNV